MFLRYRRRLYPNATQAVALAKAFGCARRVFNDGLRARIDNHEAGLPHLSMGELARRVITQAKRTPGRAWLAEVSTAMLQQALIDLDTAYSYFFNSLAGRRKGRKFGHPKFRSRKDNRHVIRFAKNAKFRVLANGRLRLPKIGDVRLRWSRPLPGPASSVAVIRDRGGLRFVAGWQAPGRRVSSGFG